MDKINLKDKETLEKLRDYLDTSDLSEKELIELVDSMTDDQKDEILDIISEDDDEDFDDELIGSAKKGVNTSLAPIRRKDMMKLSDLNNEEIVEQFQLGNQNALSADMSMYFVESPSTANEITMERYLLKNAKDDRERLWVLSTMIGKTYYHNFVTHYLEAAFQREVYRRVEKGESLTADDFNTIFKEKLEEFWGDSVKLNEGAELTWMRQPHYYMGLYSFTYQAGLTIGTAISEKIVHGTEEDRKTWLEVLKLGGSTGPIDLAKAAGVDMTTTKPIEEAIAFIGEIVDEIDELLKKLDMYK